MSGQQATSATPAMPQVEMPEKFMQGGSKGTANKNSLALNTNSTSPLSAMAVPPSTTYSDIFSGKNAITPSTGKYSDILSTTSLASPMTSFTPPNTPLVPAITKVIPDSNTYSSDYYSGGGGSSN